MKRILYAKPSITNLEINYVNDAIRTGWGENCYDYLLRFTDDFKKYLKVNHALPTSSCTGALHLALATLGIKPGDEIIVPDLTWIASIAPITYFGANPIFVDVLEDTWCIDPKKVEKAITSKTKAIIPVHLYGNLVEMDEILTIAKNHNIYVIEDAAESLGSEYKGKKAGSMGDLGVFSFHGTKIITTGEGGMLVCNDKELFEVASILADHGRDPKVSKTFWCEKIGLKYKMSNLQAALGCAQLQRIEELVAMKRKIFAYYKKELQQFDDILLNPEREYTKNSYWMPTIIFGESHRFNRDELLIFLNENGIDAKPFFYPMTSFPMFEEKRENAISYKIYNKGINLPSNFDIKEVDIKLIVEKMKFFINNNNFNEII